MKSLILILIVFFCFCSCINEANQHPSAIVTSNHYIDPFRVISEGQALLKDGDLVVRLNQDPCSQIIKNFNRRDKSYSHAGIVLYENGYPYVYHIVNGQENPDGKLKMDSLSHFCHPRKNIAFGIFRYEIKLYEVKNLINLIHKWYAKGIQFDSTFNLRTDDKMYCSEMISKALARATNKRILIKTTKPTIREANFFSAYMHLPYSYTTKLEIVAIDDLYINPYCRLIKKYNYKE